MKVKTEPTTVDLIKQLKSQLESQEASDVPHTELTTLLPVVIGSLQKKRDHFDSQASTIMDEINSVRQALPGEEDGVPTATRRPGRPARSQAKATAGERLQRNELTMDEATFKFVKGKGRKGATRMEIAQGLLDSGWRTRTTDVERFAKSVYVSGIYPNMKDKKFEHFRDGEREGRYRVKTK